CQRCSTARHCPCCVCHHHSERRAAIRSCCRRRRVACRSRSRDVHSVLLPLVAERGRPCRYHRKRRRLPRRHGLVRWLCRDRRRHCGCVHRQRRSTARHCPCGVCHHHSERRAAIRSCCRCRRVACRSRSRDVHSVLLPLVAERGRPCRYHRKRRRLPRRHGLVRRLCRDRRRYCCGVHR